MPKDDEIIDSVPEDHVVEPEEPEEEVEDSSDTEESDDESDDEYETVDITENEQYQIGSVFFENQDGEGMADILTNLVKVHISLVDSVQAMVRKQSEQISATNTLAKVVQKYCKKLDEKV